MHSRQRWFLYGLDKDNNRVRGTGMKQEIL